MALREVEDVDCWRQGISVLGSLRVTQDHLIFCYKLPPTPAPGVVQQDKTHWIAYPIIYHCAYKPGTFARDRSRIQLQCKDLTFVSFYFNIDQNARTVYDMTKDLTCKRMKLERLYAFNHKAPPHEVGFNGWEMYNPIKEFARLGVNESEDKNWRMTQINKDYVYSPTYPSVLAVPSSISDNTLTHSVKFRSQARIPALTYLHPINNCSITRCAQPLTGAIGARNLQDEALVAAIFETHNIDAPNFKSDHVPPKGSRSASDLPDPQDEARSLNTSFVEAETQLADDETIASAIPDEKKRVYGSTQQNLIVDARPRLNAIANSIAKGAGSEDMRNYSPAMRIYLGIDNIHTMRKSLKMVTDTLKNSDTNNSSLPLNRKELAESKWLEHIALVLEGAREIADRVGIRHSHVLIHCSDGWDRTSQLSALAQLCLDPYYRTLDGFIVLVEKDWVSFGHMFRHRSGHLNSEKWFEIENERIAAKPADFTASTSSNGNAFQNAISSARGFLTPKNDNSDPEGVDVPPLSSKHAKEDPFATKTGEISPIFHQFLDATWQLLNQHPTRFEFNERFLKRLLYHLYSCNYGTFLWNNEKERVDNQAKKKTRSVWDFFLAQRQNWLNPKYDPEIDDRKPYKERLIFPEKDKVRWWASVFNRPDADMNGVGPGPVLTEAEIEKPAIVAVESADKKVTIDADTTASSGSTGSSTGEGLTGTVTDLPERSSRSVVAAKQIEDSAALPAAVEGQSEDSTSAPAPAFSSEPEAGSDPLGAGTHFGSSVNEGLWTEVKRSKQTNGFTKGVGGRGVNGWSRTSKENDDLGTEMHCLP
ncbi:protein phosphatase [Venturia nashicola]|nr:protein phosphatase [Venturia nashicola]